jgi:hypothetical protein
MEKLIGILLGTKRVLIINDKKNGAVAAVATKLSCFQPLFILFLNRVRLIC